jgi:hypothetical protein
MEEDVYYASGVAGAAMHLQIVVFEALLRGGLLAPQPLREVLDAAMLGYEHGQGSDDRAIRSVATHAREQVQLLLGTLEATSPVMKAHPRPAP